MNRFLRRSFSLLFTVLSHSVFSQDANDSVTDVPGLVNEPYHWEHTTFGKKNDFIHSVNYNKPAFIDEEHDYSFQFVFTDFSNIKPGQVLNLATDTALVHCSYGILSVWSWDYDSKASFSGTITVISKTRKEIVIEEDVRIRDRDGKVLIYKSRKIFTRRKEK